MTADPNQQKFEIVVPTPQGNSVRDPTDAERAVIVGWSTQFQQRYGTLPVYDHEVPGIGRVVFNLPGPWGLTADGEAS